MGGKRGTPGDGVLPGQFQTALQMLSPDWVEKSFVQFCPIHKTRQDDKTRQGNAMSFLFVVIGCFYSRIIRPDGLCVCHYMRL